MCMLCVSCWMFPLHRTSLFSSSFLFRSSSFLLFFCNVIPCRPPPSFLPHPSFSSSCSDDDDVDLKACACHHDDRRPPPPILWFCRFAVWAIVSFSYISYFAGSVVVVVRCLILFPCFRSFFHSSLQTCCFCGLLFSHRVFFFFFTLDVSFLSRRSGSTFTLS